MVKKTDNGKIEKRKYRIFKLLAIIIFTAIIIRLIYLQIYKGDYYQEKANESIEFVAEKAPRGKIIDSTGTVMATNTEAFNITYTKSPKAEEGFYKNIGILNKLLKENGEKLNDKSLLKVNDNGELYFEYNTDVQKDKDELEIRFKSDIGLKDKIKNEDKEFKKIKSDYTDEQTKALNEKLLRITPMETFEYMVKTYEIYKILNLTEEELNDYDLKMTEAEVTKRVLEKYTIKDLMPYIIVKNTIKMQGFQGYKTIILASNIKRDSYFIILQRLNEGTGISGSVEPIRSYPYGEFGASVMGYISKIGTSSQGVYELKGYDISSDLVGASGIEAAFEDQLKGAKGGLTVKLDSKGNKTETLFTLQSSPGNDVHLTINKDVQYAAEQSLKDVINKVNTMVDFNGASYPSATRGAVVAVEVKTGRVLGLASYPSFDPNMFAKTGGLSIDENKKYFSPDYSQFYLDYIKRTKAKASQEEMFPKDESGNVRDVYEVFPRSFFNYATQGLIPPGSSLKPLTAIAGLEEGVIDSGTIMNDTGVWNLHADVLGEDYKPTNFGRIGHGNIDVQKALEVSSNFFFYETGFRMYQKHGSNPEALNTLAKYAWQFGLGNAPDSKIKKGTGIEIEEETRGDIFNFETFREQASYYGLLEIVNNLEAGSYNNYRFIPFDVKRLDDDNDKLAKYKADLKIKISDRFKLVGSQDQKLGFDDFSNSLINDIKNIMKNSDKYKAAVKEYEEKNNKEVNLDKEAEIISQAIAQFVIFDKGRGITSPAEIINASIGQGMDSFTPIQLASYIATLANGGTRYKLRLVDDIKSSNGEVIKTYNSEVLGTVNFKPENLETVKKGMYRVNHADPTSYVVQQLGNFPIATAGKTGTADFRNTQEDYDYIGRQPYATYGSFAPYDDPQIAVYTVIYDGGRGSYSAYPSRAIFEAYFKDELQQKYPDYVRSSDTFQKYIVNSPFNKKN